MTTLNFYTKDCFPSHRGGYIASPYKATSFPYMQTILYICVVCYGGATEKIAWFLECILIVHGSPGLWEDAWIHA